MKHTYVATTRDCATHSHFALHSELAANINKADAFRVRRVEASNSNNASQSAECAHVYGNEKAFTKPRTRNQLFGQHSCCFLGLTCSACVYLFRSSPLRRKKNHYCHVNFVWWDRNRNRRTNTELWHWPTEKYHWLHVKQATIITIGVITCIGIAFSMICWALKVIFHGSWYRHWKNFENVNGHTPSLSSDKTSKEE